MHILTLELIVLKINNFLIFQPDVYLFCTSTKHSKRFNFSLQAQICGVERQGL